MTLGDSENDPFMLRFAGAGVAMGNAKYEILKKRHDTRTTDNNHQGVAKQSTRP